jgi:hypothetical protein
VEEYCEYTRQSMAFIKARNERIDQYAATHLGGD